MAMAPVAVAADDDGGCGTGDDVVADKCEFPWKRLDRLYCHQLGLNW